MGAGCARSRRRCRISGIGEGHIQTDPSARAELARCARFGVGIQPPVLTVRENLIGNEGLNPALAAAKKRCRVNLGMEIQTFAELKAKAAGRQQR